MSLPNNQPFGISDEQRDRAVAHLSSLYANGTINEAELDRRLDQALGARDRVELNRSLQGLARIAPAVLTPRAPGQAAPAENVAAGMVHLSGLLTSFVVPAIVKAVATPGSRTWWEAARAMSLQLTAAVVGVIAMMVTVIFGGNLMFFAWAAWLASTIWASVRAFNGKSGTGVAEPLLLGRPKPPRAGIGGPTR